MSNLPGQDFRRRALESLGLIICGAIAFAWVGPDSWAALMALAASLGGVLRLYGAARGWRVRFGIRTPPPLRSQGTRAGWVLAIARAMIILVMVLGAAAWLWCAAVDMNEVRLLVFGPRYTFAQVIGRELMPHGAGTGFVHYAYRVSGTLAPEDRFSVRYSEYDRYRPGSSFDVTYAAGDPRVHRIGRIGWEYGLRRSIYWLLLLANGGAYLYLPLWTLPFRRRGP